MAPDGAALVTGVRHSPGVSSQIGTQPSLPRALFAFTQVDGTGRSGPAAASPTGRPMVSVGDEVSASLLADSRQPAIWGCAGRAGCPPATRRGLAPSVAHGRDIDNFLSIGVPQAPRCGYSSTATTHQPSLPLVVMRPCNSAPGGARDALARSLAAVARVRMFYAGGGRQSMRAVSLFAGVGGVDGELMPLAVGVRLGVPAPHAPS